VWRRPRRWPAAGIGHRVVDAAPPSASGPFVGLAEYAAGRTPNPCMRCNPALKIQTLLEQAHALGRTRSPRPLRAVVPARWHPLAPSRARSQEGPVLLPGRPRSAAARCLRLPLGSTPRTRWRKVARDRELPSASRPRARTSASRGPASPSPRPAAGLRRDRAARRLVDLEGRTLASTRGSMPSPSASARPGVALGRPLTCGDPAGAPRGGGERSAGGAPRAALTPPGALGGRHPARRPSRPRCRSATGASLRAAGSSPGRRVRPAVFERPSGR